jgi:hypothetical protein
MRWQFRRGEETLRAVRAVDTATDPAYRGKGLFTALTMHGLDALREDGVDFVFNTPNAQSLPGYLKMGWETVGTVPASFRLRGPRAVATTARARVPADLWSLPLDIGVAFSDWIDGNRPEHGGATPGHEPRQIVTDRSDAYLSWRYGTSLLGYRAVTGDGGVLVVRGRQRGAARELVVADAVGFTSGRADRAAAEVLSESGFDHVLRCGGTAPTQRFVPLPGGGPILTFRSLNLAAMPPLANWHLSMGDVELF